MKKHKRFSLLLALKQYKRYKRKYKKLSAQDAVSESKLGLLLKRIKQLKLVLSNAAQKAKLAKLGTAVAVVIACDAANAQVYSTPTTNPFGTTAASDYFLTPEFADLDNDGDKDILSLNSWGTFKFYENTGTAAAPSFAAPVSNPYGLIPFVNKSSLCLGDLDNDGDLDIIAAQYLSTLHYFENTGTASAPSFAAPVSAPFGLSGTKYAWSPDMKDLDNDGDLDVLAGDYYGDFYYFENTGTASAPSFAASVTNPFGILDGGFFASPNLVDMDGDSDLDILEGREDGNFYFYENTGTVSAPAYALPVTNPFFLTDIGDNATPFLIDLDNNGVLDLFAGEYNQNFYYFQGCSASYGATNTTPLTNLHICGTGSTVLSASGAGTLGWYDAATGGTYVGGGTTFNTPVLSALTTYYVQDSGTCISNRIPVTIAVNPDPVINITGTAACFGENAQVNIHMNEGGLPLTYSFASLETGTTVIDTTWSVGVIDFSNQFSTTVFSAAQVLGPPNTFLYDDAATSWTVPVSDASREYIVVSFNPVKALNVLVYENYNPGAVDTVYVHEVSTGNWVTIYTGTAAAGPTVLTVNNYSVSSGVGEIDGVRLAVNEPAVAGYNEIDAIGVIGSEPIVVSAPTGTYLVTVTDTIGCTTDTTINVFELSAIDVSTSTSSITVTSNATGATYQWIDCNNSNLPIAGETNQSYTATANGSYAVIVTMGDCSDTSACVNITGVGVYEAQPEHAGIFPNPASTQVSIHASAAFSRIHITDVNGRVILEQDNNGLSATVNLSALENGMYFVQLFNGEKPLTHTQKLVVNK